MPSSLNRDAVADIGGLAIGIGSAIVIVAIMIIIVGSTTHNLSSGGCVPYYVNISPNGTATNLSCTGIGNYNALLFDLEGYADTSIGMVMLGILVAAAMFIVWLVGGGGR